MTYTRAVNHNNSHATLFLSLSSIACALIFSIGLLTLCGWFFKITFLTNIFHNIMQLNNAIAIILISVSLFLQRTPYSENTKIKIILGKILGIMIAIFGIIILSGDRTSHDLHIDEILVTNNFSSWLFFSTGRPAPIIGLNFLLAGISLVLLDIRITLYLNQILTVMIGLTGLLALTDFIFNFNLQSGSVNHFTFVSLYASVCFVLFSLCILLMRPYSGIMRLFSSDTYGGTIARRFIPIVIVLPLLLDFGEAIGIRHHVYDSCAGMASYSVFITATLIMVTFIISWMLMKTDIKRRRVEKKLRQSTLEIHDLYNNAPCGYHSLDENGVFIQMNATELNWLGYTEQEVIGKMHVLDVMTPASQHLFHENFPKLKSGGAIQALECEFARKNKSTFTVLLNATTVTDAHGRFLRTRSTIFDITERKAIEQALRINEEQFHNAMDTAPIGMAIIALDGKYIEVNQALCRLLGYSKEELEKMTFQDITYPDDLAIDVANSKKLIAGKIRSHHIEKRYIRKDGTLIWVQLTASILRDSATNKPLYFIAQVEDITERKEVEDKIRQLAYYDSLTNLPNRRLLLDRLIQAIDTAKRHHRILAVLFIDLDNFKGVNDTLGHDVGDELLKSFAVRLGSELRSIDTVARISGDEFVIILNEIPGRNDVRMVAEKIIEHMKKPFLVLGHELQIGCSIGIALFPEHGNKISDLMKKADTAMYASKMSGRNQYRFYEG